MTRSLTLVAFAIATTVPFPALAQTPVPDGSASRISDWALAGVIWSDASLTKKLAAQAAKEADSPEQARQLRNLSQQSSRIVDALETFGWKQVKSTANTNGVRPPQVGGVEESLPNPKKVGAALSDSIKRFDTETPAGRDDPGMDDERTGDGISLDVGHYRVDDYIDETPAEARNRADAIEDGVEGAIAAASGRLGTGTRGTDHISYRESQTRSNTMAYSQDSIYDSDDYDPDADYRVDNPLGTRSINPANVARGDLDDDIDRGNPAKVVDGEDELIAAMAREQQRTQTPTAASATKTNLDRYSTERSKYSQDANWVQFHLDANEAIWKKFTTRDNLKRRTSDAVMKLKADASVAIKATDNQSLRSVLSQLQE